MLLQSACPQAPTASTLLPPFLHRLLIIKTLFSVPWMRQACPQAPTAPILLPPILHRLLIIKILFSVSRMRQDNLCCNVKQHKSDFSTAGGQRTFLCWLTLFLRHEYPPLTRKVVSPMSPSHRRTLLICPKRHQLATTSHSLPWEGKLINLHLFVWKNPWRGKYGSLPS